MGGRVQRVGPCPGSGSPAHDCAPDPLEIFREGLALFRRAGLAWFYAYEPAYEAAISATDERERAEWESVLFQTRTAWMRAYEQRSTGYAL